MRLKQKLFSTYISICLVPMLVFTIVCCSILESKEMDKLRYASQTSLESSISNVHTVFERIQTLSVTLANATWVKKVAYMQSSLIDTSRFDALDRMQSVKTLQSHVYSVDALLLAVVFPRKNYAISSYYIHTLNEFLLTDARLDYNKKDEWYDLVYGGMLGVGGPGTLTYLSYVRGSVGYNVPIPLANTGQALASLIAYFDIKTLQRLMNASVIEGMHIVAETPHGEVIYASAEDENALFSSGPSDWSLWNDERALHLSKYSPITEWTFHLFLPQKYINKSLLPLRAVSAALMFAFGLVAVLFAWVLSSRNSAPLLRLRQLLDTPDGGSSAHGSNVYSVLETAVQSVLEERNKQNSLLRQYRPQLREYYLRRLLEDYASVLNEERLALAGIAFPYALVRCLAIGPMGKTAHALSDRLRTLTMQLDIAEYSLVYRGNEVIVLNYNDEAAFSQLCLLIDQESIVKDTSHNAWVGVGQAYASQAGVNQGSGIRQSYRQALSVLESRSEDVPVLLRFEKTQPIPSYLTAQMEEMFLNCVLSGDADKAEMLVKKVMEGDGKGQPKPSDKRYLCLYICFILTKALTESGMSVFPAVDIELLNSIPASDQAQMEILRQMVRDTCARCSRTETEHNPSVLQAEISRYIQEHLYDNTLSLVAVADYFGMSGSYISRLIKEHHKVSYLDYVNRLRIDKAKQLLKGTNRDISEISSLVGYDSDVSFRRVFKRLETITPSQYRIVARINNGS